MIKNNVNRVGKSIEMDCISWKFVKKSQRNEQSESSQVLVQSVIIESVLWNWIDLVCWQASRCGCGDNPLKYNRLEGQWLWTG